MKKKYLVFPGVVFGSSDKQIHYVNADELMRLYQVSPAECICILGEQDLLGRDTKDLMEMEFLMPLGRGDYPIYGYPIVPIKMERKKVILVYWEMI